MHFLQNIGDKMKEQKYIHSYTRNCLKIIVIMLLSQKYTQTELLNLMNKMLMKNTAIASGKRHQAIAYHVLAAIYYFYNDGQENVFCASADWMQRNLNRRVEIMFPIDDENLKKEVINVLDVQLSDTMRAHIQHDGVYTKDRRGKKKLDCQEYCMEQAVERANKIVEKKTSRVFIPKMKPEEE